MVEFGRKGFVCIHQRPIDATIAVGQIIPLIERCHGRASARLLLMDEPIAALDEITRSKMDNDLLDIWRRTASTAVFVTHRTLESVYLSTRAIGMTDHPGRVVGSVVINQSDPRTLELRIRPELFSNSPLTWPNSLANVERRAEIHRCDSRLDLLNLAPTPCQTG